MLTCASASSGPPAGSILEGRGAKLCGASPWQEAAATRASTARSRALKQLKACPQQERRGPHRSRQVVERRILVPGPAELREWNQARETAFEPGGDHRAGHDGALGDLRLIGEAQPARDRRQRRTGACPESDARSGM